MNDNQITNMSNTSTAPRSIDQFLLSRNQTGINLVFQKETVEAFYQFINIARVTYNDKTKYLTPTDVESSVSSPPSSSALVSVQLAFLTVSNKRIIKSILTVNLSLSILVYKGYFIEVLVSSESDYPAKKGLFNSFWFKNFKNTEQTARRLVNSHQLEDVLSVLKQTVTDTLMGYIHKLNNS